MNNINKINNHFQAKDNEIFPSVLREIEKIIPRKAIAANLGMKYKRYCHYPKGDSAFPPDRIKDLFQITKDYRLINVVLPEDMIAVPVVKINPHIKFILKQLQIDTQREANDVLEVVEKAQSPDSDGGKLKMALNGGSL